MKTKILALCLMALVTSIGRSTLAEGDHQMKDLCKAECPNAKTEDETHKCMDEVVKKKKDDKKFRKSDCFAAYREHEKHEKEDGHKH